MSTVPLDDLALRHGIAISDKDTGGPAIVSDETKLRVLTALGVEVGSSQAIAESLAKADGPPPPVLRTAEGHRCFMPSWLYEGRAWGVSVQLYELRSHRNWGIGDFADLAAISRIAADAGADFVGINPLHALFLADPRRCSPFSPSSRLFLNPLYIAVDQLPGVVVLLEEAETIEALRADQMVDYARVTQLKLTVLHRLWASWQSGEGLPDLPRADFDAFRSGHGEALERHALFEALSASLVQAGHACGWLEWPEDYRNVESDAVRGFHVENADEVAFHAWLQWLADRQLAQAASAAQDCGMRIGLYLDFAVGEVPDGSSTWSAPKNSVSGMSIGAPPDFFTADGQQWGLAPPSPAGLARSDFEHYRRVMSQVMRHAGALRIDHAMSLWQLFFVPKGDVPAHGAYVRYPIEGLLQALSDVSKAQRTVIIGEDLGNVPTGFREIMQETTILSYRILYFEQAGDDFAAPSAYPHLALSCLSTHDLPTLKGWWAGDDIALRLDHDLIGAQAAADQAVDRRMRRASLVRALGASGSLTGEDLVVAGQAARDLGSAIPQPVIVAAHRFVAQTNAILAGIRLADLTGEDKPTNLPGTIDSYPNWRLKSSVYLEDLAGLDLFRGITSAVAAERPKAG